VTAGRDAGRRLLLTIDKAFTTTMKGDTRGAARTARDKA